MAFKDACMIPWSLRNRWTNCLVLSKEMNFMVSHIFREGNGCADSLANFGLSCTKFVWWNFPPSCISDEVVRNMLSFSLVQIRDTKPVFLRFKTYFLSELYHRVL